MFRYRRPVYICLIGALLLTTASSDSWAEKPQVWTRLRSPDFMVVTNTSEKQARRVAYQFEMIRAVFRQVFNMQGSAPDPAVIIIAAKDEASMKPLLPEAYLAKGSTQLAGYFQSGPEKNYVALRLNALSDESDEPFEPVYHEYVHYLMRRSLGQLPLWLTEGMAEFYGNTRLESKTAKVGAPSSSNLITLHQNALLPLSTLFAVNASSPYYHEENKSSIFYAESWALTHYLMTRDWRDNTHRVSQFVALLGDNVTAEDAAKRTIGDPVTLEGALKHYIGRYSFTAAVFPAPVEVGEDTFIVEPLSEAESLAIRGDFLVHVRRFDDARVMLEEALKADPKLAVAYESMGLLYAQQNQVGEANKWYSQAVALNSQSYLANYYYAMNLLKDRPDEELDAKAESSLRSAIRINPQFAPAYDALAYLLASRHRGLEEARMSALHAITLEPGNIQYRLRMVEVLGEMDQADNAARVASVAMSMAKTPEEQSEAQSALDGVKQRQEYERRVNEQQEAFKKAQMDAAAAGRGELPNQPEGPAPRESPSGGANSSHEDLQPPVLRHRGEPTASSLDVSVPNANSPAHPPRPEILTGTVVVKGTITDSQCSGGATLELSFASPSGTKQLFSDNYLKIPYSALNFTPQGILNPCVDMKGMRGQVTYHPAKDHLEQGQIVSVQLMK